MNLNEYQKMAAETMLPQCANLTYLGLGLAGETGEFCEKLKKRIRGDGVTEEEAMQELGDVLWYVGMLAMIMGHDLETVAKMNLVKLSKRKANGKIKGSGDNR
jgi:NTP pyrophosphatase (non-canonical NTP hydrolase)